MTMEPRGEAAIVRDVERQLEIAVPTEAVWRALVDAEELVRWFPMEAKVAPGEGGSIVMRWAGEPALESRIEIWVPGHHLRTIGLGGLNDLVTDIFLEGRGGATVLRLVTSGFGTAASWDEIVEGCRAGWDFELLGLKHYLEHHRGQDRQVARARAAIHNYEEAWSRLTHSGEWFPHDLAVGDSLTLRAGGVELSGVVRVWEPSRQLVVQVKDWNDALLRVTLFVLDQVGSLTAWLSAYDLPAAQVQSLQSAWQNSLDRLFAR
jgi:uncharacterized protein YndB with AHSA1/START domain